MADLAWAPDRDARDPDVVARMVGETCGTLAAGRVRPLIAVRRAGKTWALRTIEHAKRATHQARFLDIRGVTLPTWPADGSTSLLLIDEPGTWLADDKRTTQFFDWLDALTPTCHVVLALTPAELTLLRRFDRGKVVCAQRSEVYLPTPLPGELERTAPGHDLSTVPWRWRSSFYLLRTWMEAHHAASPTATPSELAQAAARMLHVGGKDVHVSAVFTDSLPEEMREALQKLGRGEDVRAAPRDELVHLGLVRADHPDGPWHITDPELAALLTPLRIHHISDVHVGDKAASTVDAKHDPTTDHRMTEALRNTFVRDEYVIELDHLARRGLGPHLVVISGDLVEEAGDAALIAQARAWVEQVRARVAANEHPCLHAADHRVLLVGGNHDVDWNKAADPDQHARHRPFAAAFADLPHPYLEQPLATRDCAPILYRDAKVAFWLLGSAELGGEQLADPRFRAVFELAERLVTDDWSRVALEAHRPKVERIDPGLVAQHALDAAAPPPSVPVRIAVLHHPVTALAGTAPEVASFTGLINAATVKAALRQKGYQLVLHGHLHHGALVTETSHAKGGAPAALHIAAAPTLGSRETQEQRGYNAISIARALPVPGQIDQIRVRVERLTHGGKGAGWKPDGAVLEFDVPA
jgi:predicted MPP superfamily phosphohydrolase